MGSTTPRLFSPLLEGTTRGQEVIDFAVAHGIELLPWQEFVILDIFTIDDETGKFKRRLSGAIQARQNGKTFLAAVIILAHMFIFDTKSILALSSNRSIARDTFKRVAGIIERHEDLKALTLLNRGQVGRWGSGQEEITLKDGTIYQIVAATRDGARGKSAGFLFCDELREFSPEAWSAVSYVTNAQPNATTLICSNAGDATSTVLSELRTRALASKDPALGWYEWSADPKKRINDRSGWAQANPALGFLIDEETLAQHVANDHPDTVRTEMLCQWIISTENPFPSGKFESLADKSLVLEPGLPTWMAVDIAPHRRTGVLVGAQLLESGKIAVGIMQMWRADYSVEDTVIASEVAEWARKYRAQVIAYDRYATASIAAKLAHSGFITEDIIGARFAQACDELLSSITHSKLVHSGETELQDQLNSCASKPVGSDGAGWRIVRKESAGDTISAAIALAMVVHFAVRPRNTPRIIEV